MILQFFLLSGLFLEQLCFVADFFVFFLHWHIFLSKVFLPIMSIFNQGNAISDSFLFQCLQIVFVFFLLRRSVCSFQDSLMPNYFLLRLLLKFLKSLFLLFFKFLLSLQLDETGISLSLKYFNLQMFLLRLAWLVLVFDHFVIREHLFKLIFSKLIDLQLCFSFRLFFLK